MPDRGERDETTGELELEDESIGAPCVVILE